MTRQSLEHFIQDIVGKAEISLDDVRRLRRDVLPNGFETRDEADLLIALDRAVDRRHGVWSAFVLEAVVQYVVWTTRPTGYVDRETANWLIASLSAGRGPTRLAEAIAFEVVREAEGADAALVTFALQSASGRFSASVPSSDRLLAA